MTSLPPVPTPRDVARGRLRALEAFSAAYMGQLSATRSAHNAERVALAAGCRPSDIEAARTSVHDIERNAE